MRFFLSLMDSRGGQDRLGHAVGAGHPPFGGTEARFPGSLPEGAVEAVERDGRNVQGACASVLRLSIQVTADPLCQLFGFC